MQEIMRYIKNQRGFGLPVELAALAVVIAAAGFGVYQYDTHKVSGANAASQNQIVNKSGTGKALNDWGGKAVAGNPIDSYNPGGSDEDFQIKYVNACNYTSGGIAAVSETCPFTVGSGRNSAYHNDHIVQFEYGTTGYCLGLNSGESAELLGCNNSVGQGGGQGTIWVQSGQMFISKYATNKDNSPQPLWASSLSNGLQAGTGGTACTTSCQWTVFTGYAN
jgi:hypothetical protein